MQNKNNKYRDYFAKIVQINDAVFDLLVDVKKNDANQYVYTIRLIENKKIKESPKQRGQALLKNSGNALTVNSISRSVSEFNPGAEDVTQMQQNKFSVSEPPQCKHCKQLHKVIRVRLSSGNCHTASQSVKTQKRTNT